jgi:hypothetical protein
MKTKKTKPLNHMTIIRYYIILYYPFLERLRLLDEMRKFFLELFKGFLSLWSTSFPRILLFPTDLATFLRALLRDDLFFL